MSDMAAAKRVQLNANVSEDTHAAFTGLADHYRVDLSDLFNALGEWLAESPVNEDLAAPLDAIVDRAIELHQAKRRRRT